MISRPTYRVTVHEALEHVAGYTITNDLTDRASVFRRDMPPIGTDWLRSKNAPGFTPLGPWIVPAGSIADPSESAPAARPAAASTGADCCATATRWTAPSPGSAEAGRPGTSPAVRPPRLHFPSP